MTFAPYAHQVEALEKIKGRQSFALLMGMRTGKTKVAIDDWVRSDLRDLIVVAPAGVYKVWLTELQKHLPDDFARTCAVWESGAGAVDRQTMNRCLRVIPDARRVLLMNVEALSSAGTGLAKECAYEFVNRGEAMMIVDESTIIKNPSSNRTYAVCALGTLARSRRILSGLPTPRSPLDAYAQFTFLDPAILGYGGNRNHDEFMRGYDKFFARYAVTRPMMVGARRIKIVTGYQHAEEIHDRIQPHSYRKLLRDCSDVPDKLYIKREVELTGAQRKAYAEMRKYMTTQLENGEFATAGEMVTCILKLHQICCGHVSDEMGTRHAIASHRMTAMREVLQEYDGKAVVWCSYDWDVRAVSRFLRDEHGERAVAQFWGGNEATREEDNRRFQQDPECLYMVATPASGGRGRDWSAAKLLVYYSNTDNLEHRDQSEERASAVAQADKVTVVDLIARGTVEERIVKSLRSKIDMAATITGDEFREWIA